ncbi:hypothetical protein K438DRAFT_1967959 [Mycena galopus ATCC 62051]|nr:hypothetical protein K438DRAFT_1967959 [Mycena galopus ATCC 62051]
MGPGSRQATLEDIFGFHNYDRMLALHRVLPRRLATTIIEATAHSASFKLFTEGLEKERPDQVKEWRQLVKKWELKQHTTSEDSPFELKEEVTMLRAIQLEIAMEEFVSAGNGMEIKREHTPGGFLTLGLEIEETQRRLTVDVRTLKDPSATQKLAFTKRCTALLKEIADRVKRQEVCAIGLPALEERMRNGEATEALEKVRGGLSMQTMTNHFKLRNYTGQGMKTRGQGILCQINDRIHIAKVRYQYSWAALLALQGHGPWEEHLQLLLDDDVCTLNERALTTEKKAQNEQWAEIGGAIVEGGIAWGAGVAQGETTHTLSWIRYIAGVHEADNDPRLEDALRVEWCKALARSSHYNEGVRLLREEMHCMVAYREVVAREWDHLASVNLPGASTELMEGRRAYAIEHAIKERVRCADLQCRWRGILLKADMHLLGDAGVAGEVTIEVELGDELDPEEEEARLEGEEEEDVA